MREIEFLDACYRLDPDAKVWGARLCDIAEGLLSEDGRIALFGYEVLPGWSVTSRWWVLTERGRTAARGRRPADVLAVSPEACGKGAIRGIYGAASPQVVVVSEMPARLRTTTLTSLPDAAADAVGLLAAVTPWRGVLLGSLAPETIKLSTGRRGRLRRLCGHLAAGQAVRSQIGPDGRLPQERAAAVLSSQGRLLEADETAHGPGTRARLIDAVNRMDRARCRRRKCTPEEALGLWRAFVDGQYSLVESFDRGGRRLILAVRVCSDLRALTPGQSAVVRLAARGLGNKQIAGRLGVATSTVSVQLSTALKKLGCRNRAELAARASTPYWSEGP